MLDIKYFQKKKALQEYFATHNGPTFQHEEIAIKDLYCPNGHWKFGVSQAYGTLNIGDRGNAIAGVPFSLENIAKHLGYLEILRLTQEELQQKQYELNAEICLGFVSYAKNKAGQVLTKIREKFCYYNVLGPYSVPDPPYLPLEDIDPETGAILLNHNAVLRVEAIFPDTPIAAQDFGLSRSEIIAMAPEVAAVIALGTRYGRWLETREAYKFVEEWSWYDGMRILDHRIARGLQQEIAGKYRHLPNE